MFRQTPKSPRSAWLRFTSFTRALALVVPVALATAFAGCGSDDGPGGGAMSALGCSDPEPGELDFLDNMEDGDALILPRGGRMAGWFTYKDPTAGVLNPDVGVIPVMETIPGGRCGLSMRAMRVTGSGFTEWGAGFGFSFKSIMRDGIWTSDSYDASAFTGITFWARIGETSIDTVRFAVSDKWSVPEGGQCDVTVPSGEKACYDHFGSVLTLAQTWKRFTFRFGELAQRNFGMPRPTLDLPVAHSVEFQIPAASSAFDVWIDDIALFR